MTRADTRASCLPLALLCAVLALVPDTAHAYIDPGTGSVLLQVILGIIAAIAVTLRLFWRKILAIFGIGKRTAAEAAPAPEGESKDE